MKEKLTPLEHRLMNLIIEGMECKNICEWLNINYNEYVKMKNNILKKLNINKIDKILYVAIKNGLVEF